MSRRAAISASLVVFAAFLPSACADECNDDGCDDGVSIQLTEPLALPASVSLEVNADGTLRECSVAADGGSGCLDEGIGVVLQGGALVRLKLSKQYPDLVTIRIYDSRKVHREATLSPAYDDVPNGPDSCTASCRIAEEEM